MMKTMITLFRAPRFCSYQRFSARMFLSSSDGKILAYNRGNYKSVEFSGHKQEVNCIDSKNGLIISGSRDQTTRVGTPFQK